GAGAGIEVGAEAACRLLSDELAAIRCLAEDLVAARGIEQNGGTGQCQIAARWDDRPQVLANFNADDPAGHTGRREEQVGAERNPHAADLDTLGRALTRGGKPALLVVLVGRGDIGLRYEAKQGPLSDERRAVEEFALGFQRQAHDGGNAESGRRY